jgi:Asp-tRNA(Asn)/Glu-tRNA(Gln) amidotransferase A subunit family amidase
MVIVTPTTACAGWQIKAPSELAHGVCDGNQTIKSMEYVWIGNFCGLPSITAPAGYLVPAGQRGAGGVAQAHTQGKVPVGLMATGEWADELGLLQFGMDAEDVGAARRVKPPVWVDVVSRAKQEMRHCGEGMLVDV